MDSSTKVTDRTLAVRFTSVGDWELKVCNSSQGQVSKWRLVTEVTQHTRSAALTYWLPGDKHHTMYMERTPRTNDIAKIAILQGISLQAPRFSQLHSFSFHCDAKTKTTFVDDVALQNSCPFGFDSIPNPSYNVVQFTSTAEHQATRSISVPIVHEVLDASMWDM